MVAGYLNEILEVLNLDCGSLSADCLDSERFAAGLVVASNLSTSNKATSCSS